jgi:hypothetical protein
MRQPRRARLLAFAIALAATSQLWAAPIASAHSNPPRATPANHRIDGYTGGQLLGQLWAVFYTAPVDTVAPCVTMGRTGKVLHPNSTATTCTVEQGTPLFVHGWGGTCDDVSPPPGNAVGRAAQLACLRSFPDQVGAINVIVDDGPAVNIHVPRFQAASPLEHVQLPAENIIGVPAQPATFTALSWVALVEHLQPGLHSLHVDVVYTDGEVFAFTHSVNVVAKSGH